VVSAGRTVISCEAKVLDCADKVLAHGTSTIMVLDAPT
jgi:acyl-coenzyme A thioesterase PaaI-like protein